MIDPGVVLVTAALLAGRTASSSMVRASEPAPDAPVSVASDVHGVEEPSTVALRRGGVTHQVTAFIRRVSVPPAVFHVRDEWVYRGSNGAMATGRFALPGGYTESSDPVLAVNGAGGEPGGAVYAAGRVMNREASNDSSTNPASIRVWVSTDGGASFPGTGSQVDMMPGGSTRTIDKPWLTVSPDGIVYVAWVRV